MKIEPNLLLPSRVRAWLVLSRGSNLPTVWSNCLAGWFLGGGFPGEPGAALRVGPLLLGASLLYTAGMWLNDAYDSAWDARHRPERPIPAGLAPRRSVVRAGGAAVLLGWVCLLPLGWATAGWALALTACIEAYNRVHKRWAHASSLMAACRFGLYPLGASVATGGRVGALPLAGGLVLALYVAGITYLARVESLPGEHPPRWPWALLAAPFAGWVFVTRHSSGPPYTHLPLLWPLGFWLWRASRLIHRGRPPIGDLLAGIVLVDLLLLPSPTPLRLATFAGLFIAARVLQRVIPAT